ncbi:hypothetical protein GQ53DRAFT_736406 [Thozetella sp. PMI_491]|nr:hypothetical protein GQ53DRAFT_736406 [Thozetella sp. PMI_491]
MSTFRGFRPHVLVLLQKIPCRCGPQQPGPAQILLRGQISSRFFQTAARFRAAARPAGLTRAAAANGTGKATQGRIVSYAQQLADKGGKTLLYEAPSHFWFNFSSFTTATFCVTYAVYHYWASILHPPEDIAWWVPHGFAVICVFMAAMGMYFVAAASRIVRTIEAVPTHMLKTTSTPKPGAPRVPVHLEVSVRRVIPFMSPKRIVALPQEVRMPFRMQSLFQGLYHGDSPLSRKEQVKMARAELERQEAARKHTMDNIMTAPFRDASRGVRGAWQGIQRSLTGEGFAKIKVKNEQYKLDIYGCWALDNGRALDRLVAVRPNEMKSD